jgi:hypothetical protein
VISKEGLNRTRIRHKNVDNEIFMEKQVLRRLHGQRCVLRETSPKAAHREPACEHFAAKKEKDEEETEDDDAEDEDENEEE